MLPVTSITMNTVLVFALMPYIEIGLVESTKMLKPSPKKSNFNTSVDYFEERSELLCTEKEFDTLVKKKNIAYYTSNGTLDKIIAQLQQAIQWEYKYILELAISKTNRNTESDTLSSSDTNTMSSTPSTSGAYTLSSTPSTSETNTEPDTLSSSNTNTVSSTPSTSGAYTVSSTPSTSETNTESDTLSSSDTNTVSSTPSTSGAYTVSSTPSTSETNTESDTLSSSDTNTVSTTPSTSGANTVSSTPSSSETNTEPDTLSSSDTNTVSSTPSTSGAYKVSSTGTKFSFSTSEWSYSKATSGGLTTQNDAETTVPRGKTTSLATSTEHLETTVPTGKTAIPATSTERLDTTVPTGKTANPATSTERLETTVPTGKTASPATSTDHLETTVPTGKTASPATSTERLETTVPTGKTASPATSIDRLETTVPMVKTPSSTGTKSSFSTSNGSYSKTTTGGLTTRNPYTDATSSPSPTSGYCDREYSCVNCTSARVCAPTPGGQGLWEVAQFPCPDYAPWCDSHSGTCSRVRTPECDLPVIGNFTCMRNGHFPDPNSCSDYYVCDNDVPLEFTCLYLSPYYSPVSQSCSNSSSDCVDYPSLCKGKSGLKVPVPRVNNLFLYCVDGAVEVVDRCIGAYRFDFDRQGCVPECPYAGLFPRDDDCAGYYQCSPSPAGDRYVMTNLNCSQGMAFSESAYHCIDRSLVPNCNATYIS